MFGHQTKTTLMGWFTIAALAAAATSFPALWSLDTELVLQGEWWRLISGQLVHLTWQHYIYDLLALGLTLCLCHRMTSGFQGIVWAALCSSVAVSMTIQILHPVDVYGGLSGLTAGLLAWSAVMLIRQGTQLVGGVLLAGMVLKVCMELTGVSVSGVDAVWQAHCSGALAGALCGVIFKVNTAAVFMTFHLPHTVNPIISSLQGLEFRLSWHHFMSRSHIIDDAPTVRMAELMGVPVGK